MGYEKCPDEPKLAGNHWKGGNYLKEADTGTKAFAIDTKDGWNLEVAIPLAETFDTEIKDGVVIG